MKDIFGVPLREGMTVAACVQFGRASYDLVPARIVGFTPQMVRIEVLPGSYYAGMSRLISAYKLAVKIDV